jgi:hypothetical protein
MKQSRTLTLAALTAALLPLHARADSPYAPYTNGPPTDPNFFEIGVWYQTPTQARVDGYKAMNVNTFVYLGPNTTQTDFNRLTAAGMCTVMPQNALGLANINSKTIISWFNTYDEPDNAQSNGSGGFTDPIHPNVLIANYNTIKANDPTRPVELNLGQGVAWNNWIGRGTRTNHPEDYPAVTNFTWTNGQTYTQGYLAGTDIGAFDFYPVNSTRAEVAGKINLVGFGVDRMRAWHTPGKPVWNYIETTNINNTDSAPAPTPTQVKAEVWLSIVHGSMGIIYFAHTITPFSEPALLNDPVMNPAVTAINAQIKSLAPVLNSATLSANKVTTNTAARIDFMSKSLNSNGYLFTVADQTTSGPALFKDPTLAGVTATVNVLGESRTLTMINGKFVDFFSNNTVHLYEILGRTFNPATTSPLLPGDANLDDIVNFSDFIILSQNFGQPGSWTQANFLNTPTIDFSNFIVLSQNFGNSQNGAAYKLTAEELAQFQAASQSFLATQNIPEPTTLTLLALPTILLLRRNRAVASASCR